MPSSEYGNAVGGGLKLKGAKDAGVKKAKKKKKPPPDSVGPKDGETLEKKDADQAIVEREHSDEEESKQDEAVKSPEADPKQSGRTELQRRHEERSTLR